MQSTTPWQSIVLKSLAAAAVFAVANLLTYHTSGYFQREHEYHAVVQGFFARAHVKSIFVGDSHVAQLDNEFLSSDAYNVGFGGDSPREIYAKLRYILSKPNEINTLFLTSDAHMFGAGRLQSSNGAFADQYLLRTGSPYGLGHGRIAATFNLVPLFNDDFVQYLKRDIAHTLKPARDADSEENEAEWQLLPQGERERIARETGELDHRDIGANPEPFEWYARIASLAREHGIRVIAVRYPGSAEYFQTVTPEEDATIDRALAAAGVEKPLDFRHIFADATYFKDPDHLSRKGVIAFMQILESQAHRRIAGGMFAAAPSRGASCPGFDCASSALSSVTWQHPGGDAEARDNGGWAGLSSAAANSLGVQVANRRVSSTKQARSMAYGPPATAAAGSLLAPAGSALASFNWAGPGTASAD